MIIIAKWQTKRAVSGDACWLTAMVLPTILSE
jgi:hypothetical protein